MKHEFKVDRSPESEDCCEVHTDGRYEAIKNFEDWQIHFWLEPLLHMIKDSEPGSSSNHRLAGLVGGLMDDALYRWGDQEVESLDSSGGLEEMSNSRFILEVVHVAKALNRVHDADTPNPNLRRGLSVAWKTLEDYVELRWIPMII